MGGATVAQQLSKTNNDSFLTAFNANSSQLDDNNPTASMDNLIPSTNGWPIEDLTGEVHDLMLRESMTWLPWMDENDTNSSVKDVFPMEGFDSQLLAQTLQLDGLFGQELNLDHLDETTSSLFYDELTFDPSPIATPLSSPTEQQPMAQAIDGGPSPVDSETTESIASAISPTHQDHAIESYHETFEEVEQDEASEPLPAIADVKEDDSSTDDDDDDDDGDSDEEDGPVSVMTTTYMYLPKRQVEEALLTKITQHLQADKLPGILSIVSSATDDQKDGEVEIDLSCLAREQLVRVMLYVDACIAEQQGGPKVKLSDYIVKEESSKVATTAAATTTMAAVSDDDDEVEEKVDTTAGQKRRRRRKQQASTIPEDGPMSMAALTKKSKSRKLTSDTTTTATATPSLSTAGGPKRRRTRKKQQDASVSIPVNAKYQDPNCLASTRPKRRSAALHKRRMLEEMLLLPSDDDDNMGATIEEDGLDHQVMVTYGEEQMDFRVVDNQTIVHQPHVSSLSVAPVSMAQFSSPGGGGAGVSIAINDEDDEEEIDIM